MKRPDLSARNRRHGAAVRGAQTPEYRIWAGIIKRCEYPDDINYKNYGGRGVQICKQWRHDFAAFISEVGSRPSPKHWIERIDNERHYEPGNVRWATPTEQNRNRRNNTVLTVNEESLPLAEWAERTGIRLETLRYRHSQGWPIHALFSAPHMGHDHKRRTQS